MMAPEPVTHTAAPAAPAAPLTPAAARSLRVALVSEGSYPFHPGGVSVWCHQLIQGMPENSFTAVALTVDGTEPSTWTAPDNLAQLVNIPLWGPRLPRRRSRRTPPASFTEHYDTLLRTLLQPLAEEDGPTDADEFLPALRGLYEYAQENDLTSAMISNDSLDRLRRAWHGAGLDSGHPGTAGPLTLRDAFVAANRVEHLLRPLSHPPVQADVCHLAMNGVSALVALASKWAYGTPLMISEHGVYLRELYLALAGEEVSQPVKVIAMRFHRCLTAAAYRSADILAPHSSYNRRWQLYGGADPAHMRTMYNGINPDDFPAARGEPEVPTIVYVGRIDPLKDLHTLIRAFAIVRERVPNALLRMFGPVPTGNEPYQASCVQLATELGVSGAASFEGRIPRQADAYQAGHLVALTSVSEGFPFTVVESMSMGRPQVCTNAGGVSEAVGDAGFVVPPRDHAAVADACVRLLEDADLRHSLGRLARQRVLDRFTLDQWTNTYREMYAELAAAGPSDASGTPGAHERPATQLAARSGGGAFMPTTDPRTTRNPADIAHVHGRGGGVLPPEDSGERRYPDQPLTTPAGRPGQAGSAHDDAGPGRDDDETVRQPAVHHEDPGAHATPILVIRVQGSDLRYVHAGQSCTVGRNPECDIPVTDSRVSWRHGVVRFAESGWIFQDAGSTTGTFLARSRVDSLQINSNSVFRLAHPDDGPVVICSVIRPETGDVVPASRAAGLTADRRTIKMHRAPVRVLRIGRALDNDRVLADLAASRYHAELRNRGGGTYEITDLDSQNGTFVNGKRTSRATATERDIIGIGRATFRIVGDELREFVNGERETAADWAYQDGEPAPEPVNGSAKEWWVAP